MLGMGPQAPLWVSLAVADWMVKMSLALRADPLPAHHAKIDGTGCVKSFDNREICGSITSTATKSKGGDPVSREVLEKGVGTAWEVRT
jgi:hypothetical protein